MSRRVLVLEDDESLRLVISRALSRAGFDVRSTASPSSAIDRMARRDADLLIADVLLGEENFLDRLEEMTRVRPDAPVLVISAQTTAATAIKAAKGGAFEYLPKPFDLDDLVAAVSRALKTEPAVSIPRRSADSAFPGLLGRSPAMQEAFRVLGRLSRVSVPVMATGPEGSGRASAARTLHAARGAADPLVEAGPSRLSSEGEELLAAASGGGLLLRRAERWSEPVQDRVLEWLERPEGPGCLIYATGGPQARFALSPGLWDRLALGHVAMPPVRERGEDSALLFEHYLSKISQSPVLLDESARAQVIGYGWPGEVAEIVRAATRIAVQGRRDRVTAEDLREALTAESAQDPETALRDAAARFAAARMGEGSAAPAEEAARIVDGALIKAALALSGGVRRDAAARLGLNRNTLARRLAALGLDDNDED
jgi:two-component system, NtrC family, nitrogen regulation response regulator GlnG